MNRSARIFAAGFVLRILILTYFPSVSKVLGRQVECVTPISSYSRLQEGVFHFLHSNSAYQSICHQSPLLLAIFSLMESCDLAQNIFYALVDTLTGYALNSVSLALISKNSASHLPSYQIAAFYMFNPYTLMSVLAKSTNVFTNCAIAGSLAAATGSRPYQSVVLLALASALSLYPAYLLPSVIVLCTSFGSMKAPDTLKIIRLAGFFLISIALYLGLGFLAVGSWDYIGQTFGTIWYFRELSPNIGLWWYFFTEMFEFFRPFFIQVFQIFLLTYSLPITIRFHHNPIFAVTVLTGLATIFKPYPEVADLGLYFTLLMLNQPALKLLKYGLVTVLTSLYSAFLGPTFYHLWIYLGSGNANFFYAITLVHTLGMVIHISDLLWSQLRYDFDAGKNSDLRQI